MSRISALDFVKGALVLLMVVYHWLNYFANEPHLFKYLRFLTPSFIFITGFLISQVYLSKYDLRDPRLPRRLLWRGAKTLLIFVVLNIGRSLLVDNLDLLFSRDSLIGTYLTGNLVVQGNVKAAAFHILVPISYLLFLSAGLLVAARYYRHIVPLMCGLFFLAVIVLALNGVTIGYLELLSMGLLGATFGYIPIERISLLTDHRYLVIAAYLGYLVALTMWGEVYLVQVIGVCLTLALIYVLYGKEPARGGPRDFTALLGRYSLLGYIGQIAILQVLRAGLRFVPLGELTPGVALVAAMSLTMLMVWIVDRARMRTVAVDRVYAAVFS